MADWSRTLRREGVKIGLVPTMGALHAGHRALIRAARLECDAVVVSVFVNPTQFGPREDFSRYPRRLHQDQALCRDEGVDVVFAPDQAAMYPDGFQTAVSVPGIARSWEGAARPLHFQGVATIVTKLLCLIQPDAAFFGQKDYQQAMLIRRLVADLNIGCAIAVLPTVREADGLALSSRNVYLSPVELKAAPVLYRGLTAGAEALRKGTRSTKDIIRIMTDVIAQEPRVRVDYLAVCDPATLESLTTVRNECVLLGAVRVGTIRLIDNLAVTITQAGSKRRGGARTGSGRHAGR
jgi:pantoate--beta-alanine ligase